MKTVELAGLKVTAVTKQGFLDEAKSRIALGHKTFVITPYSEFLYAAFQKPSLLQTLNRADFSLADGIGMLWAATFLSLPLRARSYSGKIIEAVWQVLYTLASIILVPGYVRKVLPEKIVGANLIWDLAGLASENSWSVYLLGGFEDTAELAALKLKTKNSKLIIAGTSSKDPDDASVVEEINRTRPDILFVAYGPIRQEEWIAENLPKLDVKLAIGLGGTFDYLAGKYKNPPALVRNSGLEWLWRLVTQPRRWKRIWNATMGLITGLVRYKVFNSLPFRPNVAVVILNRKGRVLVCERNPQDFNVDIISSQETLMQRGYWQFPQGGIDDSEDLLDAARREAREETGLSDMEIVGVSENVHNYVWNNAQRKLLKNRTHRNKGQTQRVVYLKFLGEDKAVKIDKHEFINYKWVAPADLANIVHPEREEIVALVAEDLERILKT